jgi:GTP-binding protein
MTHPSVCSSCHAHIRNRLRNRIALLESRRGSYHATRTLSTGITRSEKPRSWYWDTAPPTSEDLASATNFFRNYLPRKLWTATEWRKQNEPVGGMLVPEVAFLGRSNVGKSSLLNALLLSPALNHVGARPGKTTTMHAWGLAASDPITGGALRGHSGDTSIKVALLDMPGYGHASHGDWGQEIITYLERRKQLKRVFVLLDALHGVKLSDLRMLDLLRKKSISHQVIASKCDRLGKRNDTQTALTDVLWKMKKAVQPQSRAGGFAGLGEILTVGALGDGRKNHHVIPQTMIGIEEVRYAVLKAAGLERLNPPRVSIPAVERKQLPLFLDWRTSTELTNDKAATAQQTSPTAYETENGPDSKDDELLNLTKIVSPKDGAEERTIAVDEARSASFNPFITSHPLKERPSPQESPPKSVHYQSKKRVHKKKAESVPPDYKIKATLTSDEVHKIAPELPFPPAYEQPYASSIGYGLRALYEMTATKPNLDNKVNARRQQLLRRAASQAN